MRVYMGEKETELKAVVCNMCEKELLVENGILKEGCFHVSNNFGYFSQKDGQIQQFDLCEDCYDKLTNQFKVPVETKDVKELL